MAGGGGPGPLGGSRTTNGIANVNGGSRPKADPEPDQLRLLAKIARMYHERGIRQPQIAGDLNISQPRVSRLLRQAVDIGVVRTVVILPPGTHSGLEREVRERYALTDVVVVDTDGAGEDVLPALGAATADYLDTALTGGHTIGISSWSETLVSAVDLMQARSGRADKVVQIVGGLGDAAVQMQATRLTARLAENTGATPVFLSAPGLVGSAATRRALIDDASVADVTALWSTIDTALVGIGRLEPSPLLRRSGNAVGPEEQRELLSLGAVGDVCLRYFDARGAPIVSEFDQRLVGISRDELLAIGRRIGVAGGSRKYAAVRAALLGQWVNVLITDQHTAHRLATERT